MNISSNISIVFKVHSKTKYQLIANGVGVVITGILMLVLVKAYGIMGVAIAQLIGVGASLAIMCILSKNAKI